MWAEHRAALAREYVFGLRAFGFSGDTEAFGTPCNVAGAATKSAVIPCTAQKGRVALALRAQTQKGRRSEADQKTRQGEPGPSLTDFGSHDNHSLINARYA
ncbi:MAG: hypothetical protein EOM03_13905 [Clostridia bacterium]|nr:hypothetical protein [Clostridia bacterium]